MQAMSSDLQGTVWVLAFNSTLTPTKQRIFYDINVICNKVCGCNYSVYCPETVAAWTNTVRRRCAVSEILAWSTDDHSYLLTLLLGAQHVLYLLLVRNVVYPGSCAFSAPRRVNTPERWSYTSLSSSSSCHVISTTANYI